MTRSLWSSSTSRTRGAGITILLSAGASPPLVHSNPFCLPPLRSTFCTFPLFKRCFRITPPSQHPLTRTPDLPVERQWTAVSEESSYYRGRIVQMGRADLVDLQAGQKQKCWDDTFGTRARTEWERKGRRWELPDAKLHPLRAHQPASHIHMLTFLPLFSHSSPTLSSFTLHRHLWNYYFHPVIRQLKK